MILRLIQGLSGGLPIPLLMTTALRVLPPPIRLYGMAIYALTITFSPNISISFVAIWTDVLHDWHLVFLQTIPLESVAAALVCYGLPLDTPRYERLRQFDWRGALLIIVGVGSLTTLLLHGDHEDWFNSPTIIPPRARDYRRCPITDPKRMASSAAAAQAADARCRSGVRSRSGKLEDQRLSAFLGV
jgi:MFS family permease